MLHFTIATISLYACCSHAVTHNNNKKTNKTTTFFSSTPPSLPLLFSSFFDAVLFFSLLSALLRIPVAYLHVISSNRLPFSLLSPLSLLTRLGSFVTHCFVAHSFLFKENNNIHNNVPNLTYTIFLPFSIAFFLPSFSPFLLALSATFACQAF